MKPSERVVQLAKSITVAAQGLQWRDKAIDAEQQRLRVEFEELHAEVYLDDTAKAILQYLDEEHERRAKWEAMVEGKLATLEIDPPEIDPPVGPGPSVNWADLVDAARDEAETLAKQTDAWVKDRLRNSSLPEPPKGDE